VAKCGTIAALEVVLEVGRANSRVTGAPPCAPKKAVVSLLTVGEIWVLQ
jgi:hypothetical protein